MIDLTKNRRPRIIITGGQTNEIRSEKKLMKKGGHFYFLA